MYIKLTHINHKNVNKSYTVKSKIPILGSVLNYENGKGYIRVSGKVKKLCKMTYMLRSLFNLTPHFSAKVILIRYVL
jgi:hypothetical protein